MINKFSLSGNTILVELMLLVSNRLMQEGMSGFAY